LATVYLSIVIVSFNTREMLSHCLTSCRASGGSAAAQIIVVDNASTDGTPDYVRAAFPEVELIQNDSNRGFAHAMNLGLSRAQGRFHVWLNSDCEIETDTLSSLRAYLETHPDVGVVAPRLEYSDGRIQPSAQAFPGASRMLFHFLGLRSLARFQPLQSAIRRWFRSHSLVGSYFASLNPEEHGRAVDWVSGACLMARQEVTQRVGNLDETYFMYCEDTDWCHRVHAAGWDVHYLPSALATHHVGASGADSPFVVYHYYRSLLYYFSRYRPHSLLGLRMFMGVSFAIRGVAASLRRLFPSHSPMPPWWKLAALCWTGVESGGRG
jgi:GT2 family glycosyltransferase